MSDDWKPSFKDHAERQPKLSGNYCTIHPQGNAVHITLDDEWTKDQAAIFCTQSGEAYVRADFANWLPVDTFGKSALIEKLLKRKIGVLERVEDNELITTPVPVHNLVLLPGELFDEEDVQEQECPEDEECPSCHELASTTDTTDPVYIVMKENKLLENQICPFSSSDVQAGIYQMPKKLGDGLYLLVRLSTNFFFLVDESHAPAEVPLWESDFCSVFSPLAVARALADHVEGQIGLKLPVFVGLGRAMLADQDNAKVISENASRYGLHVCMLDELEFEEAPPFRRFGDLICDVQQRTPDLFPQADKTRNDIREMLVKTTIELHDITRAWASSNSGLDD